MTKFRNIIVVALILVIGIGIVVNGGINIKFGKDISMNLSGVFVATIVGIIVNAILPRIKNEVRNMGREEDIAAAKIAYGETNGEESSAVVETGETVEGGAADELAAGEEEKASAESASAADEKGNS